MLPNQTRERIVLQDSDFIDLDWSFASERSNKLLIILHGLEGNAQRPYITGTARLFNSSGFDTVAVNLRGCSGQPNLLYRSYHSGATEDLMAVIKHVVLKMHYDRIYIKGFSLGGNMVLKYLGESHIIPHQLKGAVAVSVPCDLKGSCEELLKFKNAVYARRFLYTLKKKLEQKRQHFPNRITREEFDSIKRLVDFDDVYTSKAHGFSDALDYYQRCSSLQFLDQIKVPTLIINALNDSFLSPECFPIKAAKHNPNLYLEMPKYGGHVGFVSKSGAYYNEYRALDFLTAIR